MTLAADIGERIRLARGAMTQGELADAARLADPSVGVREPSISKYENGRKVPDLVTLIAIAKALGVSLCWLAEGTGHAPPSASEDGQALSTFLATALGRAVTDGERATLESLRVYDAEPTEATYQAVLVGLRGTTRR